MKIWLKSLILISVLVLPTVHSANRGEVYSLLNQLTSNWPEANLQAKLIQTNTSSDNSVNLGDHLRYSTHASAPGHVYIMHIDSHGNSSLLLPKNSSDGKDYIYPPNGTLISSLPLGKESLYIFQTENELDLNGFGLQKSQDFLQFGDSVELVKKFSNLINENKKSSKVALATIDYLVEAPDQTEYTTRAIIRHFVDDEDKNTSLPARITFEFDSAKLTKEGMTNLDTFGEALVADELKSKEFILAGHTDDVGSDEYNMDLSKRRADAAKQYLSNSFGIQQNRLIVEAYGEAKPLEPNKDDTSRSKNRRVEFILAK